MIKFQFASLIDLLSMNGHGPYVWACYGLTAIVLIFLVMAPRHRQRNFLKHQQRLLQLQKSNTEQ